MQMLYSPEWRETKNAQINRPELTLNSGYKYETTQKLLQPTGWRLCNMHKLIDDAALPALTWNSDRVDSQQWL